MLFNRNSFFSIVIIIVAHYIQNLVAQGENQHLDFKLTISDALHIAKSFASFANASGGKLLIGVNDNGAIRGVRTEEEELYMIDAAASYHCTPPVPYSVRRWLCYGRIILEVNIPEGAKKPYYAKQRKQHKPPVAYIRVADSDCQVCSIQLMVWKKQKNPNGIYILDTENIGLLLAYLRKYPYITVLTVCRQLMISYQKAARLLAELVYLKYLDIEYENGRAYFRVR